MNRRLFPVSLTAAGLAKPVIVWAQPFISRTYLNADLNFYAAINGDDANDALSPSSPLRHWQTAWDRAATLYDTGGHNIILNVAGSFDWQENFTAKYSLVGAGNFYISAIVRRAYFRALRSSLTHSCARRLAPGV